VVDHFHVWVQISKVVSLLNVVDIFSYIGENSQKLARCQETGSKNNHRADRLATTEWRRVIGCLIFIDHFPQKSTIISVSFANNDLQLKASYGSSLPCTGWRRTIKCLVFIGHFPHKSPTISGSFAERDLQHKASFGSSPLFQCARYVKVCSMPHKADSFMSHKAEVWEYLPVFAVPLSCPCTMGWLWLVGSLQLWVSVAKEPYKRDDVLQKRRIILRSLLIVATPYIRRSTTLDPRKIIIVFDSVLMFENFCFYSFYYIMFILFLFCVCSASLAAHSESHEWYICNSHETFVTCTTHIRYATYI